MNRASAQILRCNAANRESGADPTGAYKQLLASVVLLALKDLDGERGQIERSKSIYFFRESIWGEQVFDFLGLCKEAVLKVVKARMKEGSDVHL